MADNKYAVHKGRSPGTYDSWSEAKAQVDKYPGNCHEKLGDSSDNKRYVVYEGAKPGVYKSWRDAHDQVSGYPGAKYERAKSSGDAEKKWSHFKASK